MARAAGALQHGRNTRHVDVGRFSGALGIHICGCRCEDDIRMTFFELLAIFLQGTWIARQIVFAIELHRVNEDTDHHDICPGSRFIDQLHMPVVQIAHGRDQCNTFTFLTCTADMLT